MGSMRQVAVPEGNSVDDILGMTTTLIPPPTKPQGWECTSINRLFWVSNLPPRAGNQVHCPT